MFQHDWVLLGKTLIPWIEPVQLSQASCAQGVHQNPLMINSLLQRESKLRTHVRAETYMT